jgi:hypothetical protein
MRRRSVVAFLGISLGTGLGIALGSSPVAGADPLGDWPYGGVDLPGYADPLSVTNANQYSLGPLGTINTADYNYDTSDGGTPWYSASDDAFNNDFYQSDYEQVTKVLDDVPGYPSVGTVSDQSDLFINTTVVGQVPLISTDYLDDPNLGVAESISFPGIGNLLVADSGGIEDILNAYGQTYTLFDIPFTDASAGAASDLSQLMTEFTTLF